MMRQIFAVFALLALTARADAHAFLVRSSPPVGSAVQTTARELKLEFSEAVELAFSGIEMTTASGARVPLQPVRYGDTARRQLVTAFPMLMTGSYRVKWHVVSVDTHRTEGAFTFMVRP
jgi:methionine-rich copper-binding protein CopC